MRETRREDLSPSDMTGDPMFVRTISRDVLPPTSNVLSSCPDVTIESMN